MLDSTLDITKVLTEEIKFENESEVLFYIVNFYSHYVGKTCTIHMQGELATMILRDKRFKPTTAFDIYRESLIAFACYEDQPAKFNYAYFRSIFRKKKDEVYLKHLNEKKLKTLAEAGQLRHEAHKQQAGEKKEVVANLYSQLKELKGFISGTEMHLINSLIKTEKYEKAQIRIDAEKLKNK